MTITIRHVRAEGTLIEGSRKGDGVFETAHKHGFRYFRSLEQIGLPRSRDKQAQHWRINALAEDLRAEGRTVEVVIDEDTRRSFAEQEQDRAQRAEARAEKFESRADSAAQAGSAKLTRARDFWKSIPLGQPLLADHHSYNRDANQRERMHKLEGRGWEDMDRAAYWDRRRRAAEHYTQFRNNPGTTLRRIKALEAELTQVLKWQRGESAGGFTRALTPETVAELKRQEEEINEKLDYWRGLVAHAEANGFKVWGPGDFAKGDFARCHGSWFEVLRVNQKSVTVPHILNVPMPVVTRENSRFGTYTVPYDKVQGRISAQELREKQPEMFANA